MEDGTAREDVEVLRKTDIKTYHDLVDAARAAITYSLQDDAERELLCPADYWDCTTHRPASMRMGVTGRQGRLHTRLMLDHGCTGGGQGYIRQRRRRCQWSLRL